MSSEKKSQGPISDLPKPDVDDTTAEQVKGGAAPINTRPKPSEPVNTERKI